LVTGASSGIGEALARRLAARGHGVGLVARRQERLASLARELSERHGVRAEALPADLSDAGDRDRLAGAVERLGLAVEVLVNNAGFGIYEPFAQADRERELEQVRLLVEAVIDLSARYLPGMLERGRGAIVNVSSTSGFQALPGNADYAASKAFVLFHSEAVHEEVRGSGVTVTAVCPGPVETEFQERSEPLFTSRLPKAVWVDSDRVAEDALKAADEGRRTIVPGGPLVRSVFAPNRVAPAAVALPLARLVMSRELSRGRGAA
jgi:short-subunit dehydrogenase